MLRPVLDPVLTREIFARYTRFATSVGAPAPMELLAGSFAPDAPQARCENYVENLYQITRILQENVLVNLQLDLRFLALHLSAALEQAERAGTQRVRMLERPVALQRDEAGRLKAVADERFRPQTMSSLSVVHLARSAAQMPPAPTAADGSRPEQTGERATAQKEPPAAVPAQDFRFSKLAQQTPVSLQYAPAERTLKIQDERPSKQDLKASSPNKESKEQRPARRTAPLGHVETENEEELVTPAPRSARLEWAPARPAQLHHPAEQPLSSSAPDAQKIVSSAKEKSSLVTKNSVDQKRESSETRNEMAQRSSIQGPPAQKREKAPEFPPASTRKNAENLLSAVPAEPFQSLSEREIFRPADLTHSKEERAHLTQGEQTGTPVQHSEKNAPSPHLDRLSVPMTHREEPKEQSAPVPSRPAGMPQNQQSSRALYTATSVPMTHREEPKEQSAPATGRPAGMPQHQQSSRALYTATSVPMTHREEPKEQSAPVPSRPAGMPQPEQSSRALYTATSMPRPHREEPNGQNAPVSAQHERNPQSPNAVSPAPRTHRQTQKEHSAQVPSQTNPSVQRMPGTGEPCAQMSAVMTHWAVQRAPLIRTHAQASGTHFVPMQTALHSVPENRSRWEPAQDGTPVFPLSGSTVKQFGGNAQRKSADAVPLAGSPATMELRRAPAAAGVEVSSESAEIPTVRRTRTVHNRTVEKENVPDSRQRAEEVRRAVQQIPLSEVERIADKVYRQIESRLRSEKMRRGGM